MTIYSDSLQYPGPEGDYEEYEAAEDYGGGAQDYAGNQQNHFSTRMYCKCIFTTSYIALITMLQRKLKRTILFSASIVSSN